jgi:hypothetical protein
MEKEEGMTEDVNETNGLAVNLNDSETQRQLEQIYLECLEILESMSKGTNPPKATDPVNREKPQRSAARTTVPDYT